MDLMGAETQARASATVMCSSYSIRTFKGDCGILVAHIFKVECILQAVDEDDRQQNYAYG